MRWKLCILLNYSWIWSSDHRILSKEDKASLSKKQQMVTEASNTFLTSDLSITITIWHCYHDALYKWWFSLEHTHIIRIKLTCKSKALLFIDAIWKLKFILQYGTCFFKTLTLKSKRIHLNTTDMEFLLMISLNGPKDQKQTERRFFQF